MIKKLSSILALVSLLIPSVALAQISIAPTDLKSREFNLEVPAGKEVNAEILITNLSKESGTRISIHPVDATQNQLGTFGFTKKNEEQNAIGKWLKITNPEYDLKSLETKNISFSVAVPEETPPGMYVGGISVEEIAEESESKQIEISSRLVTKVFVRVPGKIIHDYQIKNFSEKNSDIELEIENTGNTILTVKPNINLQSWLSKEEFSLEKEELKILQGQSAKLNFNWEDKPAFGAYNALAELKIGQYDFLKRRAIKQETVFKTTQIFMIPWLKFAVVILFIGIAIFFKFYLNKKLQAKLAKAKKYKVKKGENIMQIAEAHKIKWKLLAKINKIEAPYKLEEGQEILVPTQDA